MLFIKEEITEHCLCFWLVYSSTVAAEFWVSQRRR